MRKTYGLHAGLYASAALAGILAAKKDQPSDDDIPGGAPKDPAVDKPGEPLPDQGAEISPPPSPEPTANTWDGIGGEHGIDGRAPVDMAEGTDDGKTLGEQAGYESLAERTEPYTAPEGAAYLTNDDPQTVTPGRVESAVLDVADDISGLTRDIVAGCRDMANDARTPEDLKIQLNACANRFEEKSAAIGEAIRVKLAAG
jgi:hypothetical protein